MKTGGVGAEGGAWELKEDDDTPPIEDMAEILESTDGC